jgi:hypothetical protein
MAGFDPVFMAPGLFDFQTELVEWSVRMGRAAIFADCGLGKTPMQLTWAQNVVEKTNKPVLILTPLAVAQQTIRESSKFGVHAERSTGGRFDKAHIVVANYERLAGFDPADFAGVVCDESSILKNFAGVRRTQITAFMRKMPFRLLTTATAAPNDYVELGTSSEALGNMGMMDMLNQFFVNDQNNSSLRANYGEAPKWRFKGHAELPFWRWVCTWARACRAPSDLGYDDEDFVLPKLIERDHVIEAGCPEGFLFSLPATRLHEQRDESKRTIRERCEMVSRMVTDTDEPFLIWVNRNEEGKQLRNMIPGAVEISGSDCDEKKEERFLGFCDGSIKRLITKQKIGAWGLNFQHCNRMVCFPTHSFEQYYQGVRRCWRFGQKRPVYVDRIMTEGEVKILENLNRKAGQAESMFSHLVSEMRNALDVRKVRQFDNKEEVPSWL